MKNHKIFTKHSIFRRGQRGIQIGPERIVNDTLNQCGNHPENVYSSGATLVIDGEHMVYVFSMNGDLITIYENKWPRIGKPLANNVQRKRLYKNLRKLVGYKDLTKTIK